MFEGVQAGEEGQGNKRVAVSGAMSLLIIVGLGAAAAAVGGGVVVARHDDAVIEVSFDSPAEREPEIDEPPPPPPPAQAKPGKKKNSAPPSAPLVLSEAELAEADERHFQAGASAESLLDVSEIGVTDIGLGDQVAPPPPPPPAAPEAREAKARRAIEPVYVHDDIQPPVPASDNPLPEYPKQARRKGLEGLVVLKVIIDERGRVTHIQVVEGDEPFLAAALAVVERWKYAPARVDGRPAAVYRLIKVPFRLTS